MDGSITIGEYRLSTWHDDNGVRHAAITLASGDNAGDGMGVSLEKIEALLHNFYVENF